MGVPPEIHKRKYYDCETPADAQQQQPKPIHASVPTKRARVDDVAGGVRRNSLLAGVTCCRNCSGANLVVNAEHRMVCRDCAHINDYFFTSVYGRESTYKRIVHFNERLSQFLLTEPSMPDELFELLENEAIDATKYPDWKDLTKEDIKRICKSVKVPPDLQEKYRSKKFKQRPLTNMTRFVEKWLSIKNRLCGWIPTHPEDWVMEEMRTKFVQLQVPFEYIRHTPQCDGNTYKCHKVFKCRHNFPNLNFTIVQLLKLIIKDDKLLEEEFMPLFPQLKTRGKRKNLQKMWDKLIDYVGWGKIYAVVPRRQRILDKIEARWKNKIVAKIGI